MIEINKVCLNR